MLSKIIAWHYSKIENYCIQNSNKIIFITQRFQKYFKKFDYKKSTVIENWGVFKNKVKNNITRKWKKKLKLKNEFVFLYAGTLSYKHDSQLFLKLAEKFKNSKVIVFSEGKFANALKLQSKKYKNLIIENWINFNELQSVFSLANVLLVSLSKDAGIFSVPSKILSYFYSGKPILGMLPGKNLAREKIVKLKTGYVAEPGNINDFLYKAKILYGNKKLRKKMGQNGLKYAKTKFNINMITKKFEKIFKEIKYY